MRIYLERIHYGKWVAIAKGETISGGYWVFKNDSIGGKHNYQKISLWRYLYMGAWYWIRRKLGIKEKYE